MYLLSLSSARDRYRYEWRSRVWKLLVKFMYLPFSPGIDRLWFCEDLNSQRSFTQRILKTAAAHALYSTLRSRLVIKKKKERPLYHSWEFRKIITIRFFIEISDISDEEIWFLTDYGVMNFFHIWEWIILNKYIHVLDKKSLAAD